MTTNLDWHDIIYLMEGCAGGSHLRQGIWQRAVDEFWKKLSDDERKVIYWIAKRDITERFFYELHGEPQTSFGYDDFAEFLARFNPSNQYRVTMDGEVSGKHIHEVVDAFLWARSDDAKDTQARYHTGFTRFCASEYIVETEHKPYQCCGFNNCPLKDNCARYFETRGIPPSFISYYRFYNAGDRIKCDHYINSNTLSGI